VSAQLLELFGAYGFAARSALVLSLMAMAIYTLLNAGIFAVPQTGLMAVGAYTATILSLDAHWPFGLALLGGTLAGAAAGFVLAALLGRLNGIYLAIATLAFSEAVSAAVLNIPATGTAQGRVGIPRAAGDPVIVASVLAAFALLWALARSRFGLAIVAMREDSLMARHQGIHVWGYRIGLFTLAGALCGLAGGLNVHLTGFVEPGFFSFGLLSHLLAGVVIGGMTFVAGPLVGTGVMFVLSNLLTAVGEFQTLANGVIIVLVVAFAPNGLIGLARQLHRRGRGSADGSALAAAAAAEEGRPRPRTQPAAGSGAVLDLTDIVVRFGGITALQGVSLQCARGELLGVIGPNGSGKTTLLNVISGVYTPASGQGTLLGRPLAGLWGRPHALARAGVSRTFQTIRLVDSLSVADNVTIGLHGLDAAEVAADAGQAAGRRAAVERILREHRLEHLAGVDVGELSYGMRRRVEIARAVASRPRLLLLDEPTAGMDPQERAEVFAMVAALLADDIAVVVVEHDVAMMGQYCDRLVVLDFGQVIAAGPPDEVLRQDAVVKAYVGGTGKAAAP